jgi:GH15 family glucan-1,4-alpha-glucosidase
LHDARPEGSAVIRLVRRRRGRVAMHMELIVRFEYGAIVPWVSRVEDGRLRMVAGPDELVLAAPVETYGEDLRTVADFTVEEGKTLGFALSWTPSHRPLPARFDATAAVDDIARRWSRWSSTYKPEGEWSDAVGRSLITLKAFRHFETGGIVAAATTSLPEERGGTRNCDYRYCWLRDATFTLYALLTAGYTEEARAWRQWLVRAVAGSPSQMQIMYGVAGERRLTEFTVGWLTGYGGAAPVRTGDAGANQRQLDVYGEVLDCLYQSR